MDVPLNHVVIPANYQELFLALNRFPDAVIYAGGTHLIGRQENNILNLPPILLCLDRLTELHRITRTEHYLEIGSMVNLNKIINLGKTVPKAFRICLENIAGFQVRNIATIGGNISCRPYLLDIPAPLAAFDAQYELRSSPNTSRWVSAFRFHSSAEYKTIGNQEIITRIRLPLHQWDYSVYKKLYSDTYSNSGILVFLAKTGKNILSEIKIIIKSGALIRNKEGEDILNGKNLPLNRKTADDFIENWKDFFKKLPEESEYFKYALLNIIKENVYNLSSTS
ncbi:MAG: FAD binding domain-containing protein [Treponema sp.]|nr:FAD binding domain-containing protein [Treponema sp.]